MLNSNKNKVNICKIKTKFINRYLICILKKFPSNHGEVSVMVSGVRSYFPMGGFSVNRTAKYVQKYIKCANSTQLEPR